MNRSKYSKTRDRLLLAMALATEGKLEKAGKFLMAAAKAKDAKVVLAQMDAENVALLEASKKRNVASASAAARSDKRIDRDTARLVRAMEDEEQEQEDDDEGLEVEEADEDSMTDFIEDDEDQGDEGGDDADADELEIDSSDDDIDALLDAEGEGEDDDEVVIDLPDADDGIEVDDASNENDVMEQASARLSRTARNLERLSSGDKKASRK